MKTQAIWFFTLTVAVLSQSPPENPGKMTRLAVRFQSPEVPANGFGAKPKIIYRAGDRYCRIEETADVDHGIQALGIINEPDAWSVNLITKTGGHIVDTAPTQICHLPLFADAQAQLKTLEFGRELSFFKALKISPGTGPSLFGKPTQAYTLETGDFRLQLFTTGTPEHPLVVARTRGSRQEFYFYDAFEELPFDAKLFAKPLGIKFQEEKER